MALGSVDQWKVESLRLSIFSDQVLDPAGKNWWRSCTDSEPETTLNRRQTAEFIESGSYAGGTLEFKSAFNRVDWLFGPAQQASPTLPTLPVTADAIGTTLRPMAEWMVRSGVNVVRVAVGAVVLKPVADATTSVDTIAEYVPALQLDSKLARDINFQINFPRPLLSVSGETVNRMSKWASMSATLMAIQPGALAIPQMVNEFYCRAEFDFSTGAGRTEVLPADSLIAIVDEFAGLILEQLREGVKP